MKQSPFSFFSAEALQGVAKQASELLPSEQMREDIQKNMQLLLQSQMSKLNLVSRKEFDAQAALLAKTQEKLSQLEQQLADLLEQKE